jgi:hypothetical protein
MKEKYRTFFVVLEYAFLVQNSIGGMMRTELAAFRYALTVFQIALERALR